MAQEGMRLGMETICTEFKQQRAQPDVLNERHMYHELIIDVRVCPSRRVLALIPWFDHRSSMFRHFQIQAMHASLESHPSLRQAARQGRSSIHVLVLVYNTEQVPRLWASRLWDVWWIPDDFSLVTVHLERFD